MRKRIGVGLLILLAAATLALCGYAIKGYVDALRDAPMLVLRADRLIANGRGPADLGAGRFAELLRVEDPGFVQHDGIDVISAGAGLTSLTQSLSKRLAFERFRPGLRKIRQTTYAMGLENRLTKNQIAALFLDTAELGRGPDGWMRGFFAASETVYARPPAALSDREFRTMVAVLIAPSRYRLTRPDAALGARVDRIERLLGGGCAPADNGDVWLEGCAA